MAKKKVSILKKQRQEETKTLRNRAIRSRMKTRLKKARAMMLKNDPASRAYLNQACRELDKAASKGVLHPRAAARKKSRLMKFANKYANQSNK